MNLLPVDATSSTIARRAYIGSFHSRNLTSSFHSRRRLDEIDERAQWCGREAPARIVEKRPWKALPPRLKNGLKSTAVEMRAQPVLEKIDYAGDHTRTSAIAWLFTGPTLLRPSEGFVAINSAPRMSQVGTGSCQWRRLRIGNRDFIQELAEREYADLLIFPEIQHCPIASYYNVSVPRHSALENAVVGLVVENS